MTIRKKKTKIVDVQKEIKFLKWQRATDTDDFRKKSPI